VAGELGKEFFMHDFNLKMIKVLLVIAVLAVVLSTIGGITLLKDNYYSKTRFFVMQWDYVKTKIAFAGYDYGSLSNWILNRKVQPASKIIPAEKTKFIPVLLYHGVIENPDWKNDGVNISLSDFRTQMFALKTEGYQTITLTEFLGFMKGEKDLPEKSILISFDDGRKDSYYVADPIFRALDFNAVMFVITGRSIGEANKKSVFHLTEDELHKMIESGRWEAGSHTQNGHNLVKIDGNGTQGHFLTDKLWVDSAGRLETEEEYAQRIKNDLLASKKDLENNLGVRALGFAYPFGDYGDSSQNFPGSKNILINEVNSIFPLSFRQAGESEFPGNYPGADFRLIKRLNVSSDMSKDQLLFLVNDDHEKTLPYKDTFSENRGWLTGWGNFELKNGLLLTRASASEDSSLTFLNGTYTWTNYEMNATARLIQGNAFAAVVRYTNGNNYASCDFSTGGVSLSQRVNGIETTLSESPESLQIIPNKDIAVKISVTGNNAVCYIEGREAASGFLSPILEHGGIGFKTWDNTINNSSLLISNLMVNPLQ